jgi:HEPN domain-containing protein
MQLPDPSQSWTEQANYDLETAQAMLHTGRYLYVLFCCQQAIEKMLKALIARRTSELPPRVHQLARLAELAGVEASDSRMDFLRELSAYYIHARYPEEVTKLTDQATEVVARRIMEATVEVIQWLKLMLQ